MRKAVAGFAWAAALTASAALTVSERDGAFQVLRGDETVVSSIAVLRNGAAETDVRSSFARTADGTKVWNRWSEARDGRFRLEVAEHPDGSVEISLQGEADILDRIRERHLELTVPGPVLQDKPGRFIPPPGRDRYADRVLDLSAKCEMQRGRWFAANGLIFDFSPVGAGDFYNCYERNAMHGLARMRREGPDFKFLAGGLLYDRQGGYTGGKVVLREGTFDDVTRYHFFRQVDYILPLGSSHCLSFAAPKHGEAYSEGDVAFDEKTGYGWVGDPPRQALVGHPEGARYSALAGEGEATYRFAGLQDGWYIVTLEAGNYTGAKNRFDVSAAGTPFAKDVSVPAKKARQISRAVHVMGGSADVKLAGKWLVSIIGLQPLMSDAEDYSVRRGFWVTDGYEPCAIYRNVDWKGPFEPVTADDTIDLPVPGTEFAGTPREPPAPVELPPKDMPELAWTENASICRILHITGSLAELDDPAAMKKYLDDYALGKGYDAAIVSGMHSRHTYLGNIDRGCQALGRIATELHKRGMKLIDHHDAPIVWNVHSGFRVMMERLPETMRDKKEGLPSHQFCPTNPDFARREYDYVRSLVKAGVDGFQIDEVEYYSFGCVCAHCREQFRCDTGWSIPANECNSDWLDPKSAFARVFYDWHRKMITNWFVGLRRYVKDLKPDLVLSMYTTHSGFTGSHPARSASSDLLDCRRVMNMFGHEVMSRKVMKCSRAMVPNRRMANILRKDGISSCWGWFYNVDWQNDYASWAIAQLAGQSALTSGHLPPKGCPQFQDWAGSGEKMSTKGIVPVCETVLLFSAYSRDWNPGFGFRGELFGTAQALEALHVPYRFMSDDELEKGVPDGTKLLFVGTATCLSDAEIAAIRAFAHRGGKVRLSGIAGLCDRMGNRRAAWPFADVFVFEPKEEKGDGAPIVEKPFGKGSFVYCANERGAAFEEIELERDWTARYRRDPEKEGAFWREVAELTKDATWWKCRAPDQVYTSIWKEKSGVIVIHFYNATGVRNDPDKPVTREAPDPAFPPLAEDIVFTVPIADVKAVTAASPDFAGVRPLEFRSHSSGRTTVRLPKECLSAYTLVRIQGK